MGWQKEVDEHKISLQQLYKKHKTDENGLSSKEAKKRLEEFGPNILHTKKQIPLIIKFLKQFYNFFAILLITGSLLAFFAEYLAPNQGNLYIGIALLAVTILNAIFTFIQEYQSEKIMETFKKMLPEKSKVLRDGKVKEIPSSEIVPGDVILVSEGDKIPADARLIEQTILKVDNSSITGESEPELRKLEQTSKNILESRNMIFSGTSVQSGSGKAVVYGTSMNTQIGHIVKLTKETKETISPLKKELQHFIKIISSIAIILGFLFFIISFIIGNPFMGSLIFAIGIIVANVPEGLLPTVTLCLSIASKRMAKRNALIKNLESVETLGSTTVICTDKTGTITQNKMAVNSVYVDMKDYTIQTKGLRSILEKHHLVNSMVLCNNSKNTKGKHFSGDPTETSLVDFSTNLFKLNNVKNIIQKNKRILELPFDSKTKRMITVNKVGSKYLAFLKGAPESVIKRSTHILINGRVRKITKKDRVQIDAYYQKFAKSGERVLAFAYKDVSDELAKKKLSENNSEIQESSLKEANFIFTGLVGMLDAPRKEIPFAIDKCKTAGIRVIMITGDYSLTAESIARKVGLIENGAKANIVTGDELQNLTDSKLKQILKKDNLIFSRTTPIHKLRIVKALQSLGEVVTVTGDGVNDAPALKNADMGVAMGITGTEVAREASDMVLMDDNFATIVNAVEEGRTIFENIKKFIAYILTSNVPEILPFIAFVLLGIPLPLTVVLILAIDLGTDILPALGLGTELPEHDVMSKKPRAKTERLLTKNLLFMSYGIVGMIQAAAGFASYFYVLFTGGWTWGQDLAFNNPLYQKAITAFFVSIIICQIADVWICRTRRQSVFKAGFMKNKLILLGIATEILIIAAITYLPAFNTFFGTHPLLFKELLIGVPFAVLILVGDEIRKVFVRRENKFVLKYLTW